VAEWSKHWNIEINEDKAQAMYFSHRIRPPESLLTLNGWNIPFVNNVKYLGVIFHKKITWKLHIEMIAAKAFRAFITTYSLFKRKRLSTNLKLYFCGRYPSVKIAAPPKQGSPHHWQFSKAHISLRIA
jgi:hypothetical protein